MVIAILIEIFFFKSKKNKKVAQLLAMNEVKFPVAIFGKVKVCQPHDDTR